MKIDHKYMMKHLERAALEQLIDMYKADGYEIMHPDPTSSIQADAVFKKGRSIRIIEIVGEIKNKNQLAAKLNAIKMHSKKIYADYDVKLELVPIIPHREIIVSVDGLESALFDVIENDYLDVFNEICTHFHAESISDLEISKVIIDEDGTNLIGNGTIDMVLQYGSDGDVRRDDGHVWRESFPFEFDIIYDGQEVTEANNIIITVTTDYDEM